MTNLQSTVEGSWIQLNSVTLTEDQKTLLQSTKSTDNDAKVALQATLKSQRETTPVAAKVSIAQAKYDSVKPTLAKTDVYQLISFDAGIADNNAITGILNCRVNGEHEQVRF